MTLEFHLALSSLENGDFETGDFTGWDQRSGEISASLPHLGSYCSRIVSTGVNIDGALTHALPINLSDFYNIIGWNRITSYIAGDYLFRIQYFSDVAGSDYISVDGVSSLNTDTEWTKIKMTVSGSGMGADLTFPSSTQAVRLGQAWRNTPQGAGRMDDVIFGNLVQLYPEYDYKGGRVQLRNEMRTPSGKGYLYKHGEYDKFQFNVNYLPSSDASIVNSWWDTNAKLQFLITSGDITEVHSVVMMNKDTPFQSFNKPYADKYKGKVLLEGY